MRAALVTLVLLLAGLPAALADAVFDLSQTHPFAGYGVQVWVSKDFSEQRARVLRDLNIHFVRLGALGVVPESDLKDGATVQAMQGAFRPDPPNVAAATRLLADELRARDIQVHLVAWEVPSRWRKQGGPDADAAHSADYARYVAAQVLLAQSLGFRVAFVEPANEPDGNWNTRWAPDDYARMVKTLRQTLDASGLGGVGIEGPGTGTMRAAPPFLRALHDQGALSSLAALSVHDWDTRIAPDPVGLTAAFRASVAALGSSLPVEVTEFNDENPRWSEPPYVTGPAKRGPAEAADSADFAVALSAEGLKLIADGAVWIADWQIQDLPWGKDSLGLIDLQGHLRPSEQALRTWVSAIPPGASVAALQHADPRIVGALFRAGHAMTAVVINTAPSAATLRAALQGADGNAPSIASEQDFLAAGGTGGHDATIDHGVLTLKLPPRAVVAVVLGG